MPYSLTTLNHFITLQVCVCVVMYITYTSLLCPCGNSCPLISTSGVQAAVAHAIGQMTRFGFWVFPVTGRCVCARGDLRLAK
jgi:hypothetical protein